MVNRQEKQSTGTGWQHRPKDPEVLGSKEKRGEPERDGRKAQQPSAETIGVAQARYRDLYW